MLPFDTLFRVGAEMPREASNGTEDATSRSDSDPRLPLLPPTRARRRALHGEAPARAAGLAASQMSLGSGSTPTRPIAVCA